MAPTAALPTLTAEPGFTHYLEEIRRFPMLEPQEEYMLAKSWREHGDRDGFRGRGVGRVVPDDRRMVAGGDDERVGHLDVVHAPADSLDASLEDLVRAQDVGLDRLHGVVLAGGHMLERGGVRIVLGEGGEQRRVARQDAEVAVRAGNLDLVNHLVDERLVGGAGVASFLIANSMSTIKGVGGGMGMTHGNANTFPHIAQAIASSSGPLGDRGGLPEDAVVGAVDDGGDARRADVHLRGRDRGAGAATDGPEPGPAVPDAGGAAKSSGSTTGV